MVVLSELLMVTAAYGEFWTAVPGAAKCRYVTVKVGREESPISCAYEARSTPVGSPDEAPILPLKESVPEENSDFSKAKAVVTSPALPKPPASAPAINATLALRASSLPPRSDLLRETTTSDPVSLLSLSFSNTRRMGRLVAERKAQCQSSASSVSERRVGISLSASARVLTVRLMMTCAPECSRMFSRSDGRKEAAVTLT